MTLKTALGFTLLLLLGSGAEADSPPTPAPAVSSAYGNGYLEESNGLPVLHLKGSPRDMGLQYGFIMGDRIQEILNLIDRKAKQNKGTRFVPEWSIGPIRQVAGWLFWRYFPQDTKIEMEAMVEGARLHWPELKFNRFDLAFTNSMIDIVGVLKPVKSDILEPTGGRLLKFLGLDWLTSNCCTFAAWGPRTVGGNTFQTRNVDVPTGMGLEKFPLVIVYRPEGKIPYVSAAFVGMTGLFTGLNAYGLGLGQVWAFSKKTNVGVPWQIQMKEVFSQAASAGQAVDIFRGSGRRTYGNNFVLADASGRGYAVETTPEHFKVFKAGDPREELALWRGSSYGIPLNHAVLRGDVALDPDIRALQTASNGPVGDPRAANAYIKRYRGQSDRLIALEKAGIRIGRAEAETISRETAIRKGSLQTAVYANSDRDLWVSYAEIKADGSVRQAYEAEYRWIPFSIYLQTLEFDASGKIQIKSWVPGRYPEKDFELTIRRGSESLPFTSEKELLTGDVLELRHRPLGTLADRLVIAPRPG